MPVRVEMVDGPLAGVWLELPYSGGVVTIYGHAYRWVREDSGAWALVYAGDVLAVA